MAKAAFPKLVALQARLDRKEEQLSAKGKALHEAMHAIGEPFVKYGAVYARPGWTSEWDAVRERQPRFAGTSEQELYEQYSIEYKINYTHEDMSSILLRHLIETKHIDLDDHFHGSPGELT